MSRQKQLMIPCIVNMDCACAEGRKEADEKENSLRPTWSEDLEAAEEDRLSPNRPPPLSGSGLDFGVSGWCCFLKEEREDCGFSSSSSSWPWLLPRLLQSLDEARRPSSLGPLFVNGPPPPLLLTLYPPFWAAHPQQRARRSETHFAFSIIIVSSPHFLPPPHRRICL